MSHFEVAFSKIFVTHIHAPKIIHIMSGKAVLISKDPHAHLVHLVICQMTQMHDEIVTKRISL